VDALMYCPECHERGRFPWEHRDDCVEALRHKVRWYEGALPWILLVLVTQTILLIAVFVWLERLP
jgi:hypothetical protein